MEDYIGRGIHNVNLFKSFKEGGQYADLMDIIRDSKDLDFEIRNNYVNIYYEGCNIAKISSTNGSVQFDKFYFLLREDIEGDKPSKKEVEENCKPGESHYALYMELNQKLESLTSQFKNKKFHTYIDAAKAQVNEWFISWNINKDEKSAQQKIVMNNNETTELCIIDNEYQISTKAPFRFEWDDKCKYGHTSPRFDLIAVNKEGQIYIVELKKGLKACVGKAGLKSHTESFRCTIQREWMPFVAEMKRVLEQKKELGLIDNNIIINDIQPRFVFAYVEKDGESIEAFYSKCREEGVEDVDIYICDAESVLKRYNR